MREFLVCTLENIEKRSVSERSVVSHFSAPYYQEPRFKRDLTLDIDPEDLMTLLSLWENERQRASRYFLVIGIFQTFNYAETNY